ELKPEIGELSKLTKLDLTGNNLTSLPPEIGNLSSLTYLNLSRNGLTNLPTGIGNFAVLEELNVSNQIDRTDNTKTLTTLPDEIGNIGSLKKLYLNQNKLENIPTTIGNLVNLENLNIEYNALTSLPTTINNLTMLDELIANNNFIDGVLDLSNLDVLDRLKLEYNTITGLKLNLAPTAFNIRSDNTFSGSSYFSTKRNALGCIEVPQDELVSWQLSDANGTQNFIDNGVIYSDNCSAVTNNSIPDKERDALIAIYNKTKGTDWKNDLSSSYNGVLWETDNTLKRNVGSWYGVTTAIINGQKHVTKVELNSNQLDGTIPSVIKNLTQLKELEFNSNTVSEIALEIGELENLEQLTFTRQYDSDKAEYVLKTIPAEINNITSLRRLDISSNQLEGNLDFSNLINLDNLSVSSNQITGLKIGVSPSIFDNGYDSERLYSRSFSFSSNPYLNCIAVPQNTISDWETSSFAQNRPNIVWGQDCTAYNNVPQNEIQALVDLYNNLDGANWRNNSNWNGNLAKALINNPYNATKWQGVTTKIVDGGKHITDISLSSNQLKGALSESIGNLTKLENLQLSSNEITGVLPTNFGNLTALKRLSLNNNQFTGLPTEMNALVNLEIVYLQSNQLSSKIPNFTKAANLSQLNFNDNQLHFGDFEDEFQYYKDNVSSFSYTGQAKVGEEKTIDFGDGFDTVFTAEVRGANNEYQWYRNWSKIEGATDKTYTLADATQQDAAFYYCVVSNSVVNDFNIETERITLNYDATLSTEDNVLARTFQLYPNPVVNLLQIRNSENIDIKSIEVYNTIGKKIKSIRNPNQRIDVSELVPGIYLLNIITEKGKVTKRIMKK
uniref:T9SS type A sorting domain-containing protein n=1 Tax=uncultured Polaribacter sp. TaxID=174711 RepID=UPI00261AE18C